MGAEIPSMKNSSYVALTACTAACIVTVIGAVISVPVLTITAAVVALIACGIQAYISFSTPRVRVRASHSSRSSDTSVNAYDIEKKINEESATTIDPSKVEEQSHRDEESGLLSGSFFPVYLEQRITAARRTLRPISLVIFELDGLDTNDSNSPSDRNFYITAVGDVVKRTLRESDCAFRVSENVFAAVMDDTTESGAVWAAERVRGVLHTGALAGRVTVCAGVACYPSHALEPSDLIESATVALRAARARGVDQVEIAAETK